MWWIYQLHQNNLECLLKRQTSRLQPVKILISEVRNYVPNLPIPSIPGDFYMY